jgi:hypothetical protein
LANILDLHVSHVGGLAHKIILLNSIVATSQRGRATLSCVSQEIGCKSRLPCSIDYRPVGDSDKNSKLKRVYSGHETFRDFKLKINHLNGNAPSLLVPDDITHTFYQFYKLYWYFEPVLS